VRACYLIQNHRAPRQVLRLVATLKRLSPCCRVLVAHDATGAAVDPASFTAWPDVELLKVPGPAERGRLSLLDPYFRGIEHLRADGRDYDWLVYLSAQDYPTLPLARSEAVLAAAAADAFLRYWPALAPVRGRVRDRRYRYAYFDAPRWVATLPRTMRLLNRAQSIIHVHLTFGPRVGLRRWRLPLPDGWVPYRGYQWTTLRRRCAEDVLDAVRSEPSLLDYFRRSICPDEALVQTILVNQGRYRLCNDDLRYLQTGQTRDGRARTLGVGDLAELLSGGYHFARKFDLDTDSRVLDLLDDALGADTSGGSGSGRGSDRSRVMVT
jgi:hypothetical protein